MATEAMKEYENCVFDLFYGAHTGCINYTFSPRDTKQGDCGIKSLKSYTFIILGNILHGKGGTLMQIKYSMV